MHDMYKLLHISKITSLIIETFIPRVPKTRLGSENGVIRRICTTPSIEGCMVAHPYLSREFRNIKEHEDSLYVKDGKIGFLYRIYHFEVEKENVMNANEIGRLELVPDVSLTGEHWIMRNIKPEYITHLFITDIRSFTNELGLKEFVLEYEHLESEFDLPKKLSTNRKVV